MPRDYFARRMLELEAVASSSSALGDEAFADPVAWRDDDGRLENLAYTGAPLLALLLHLDLVERGHPGLGELVRDLIATGEERFTLEDLRRWFERKGLGARWERSVEGTELPPCAELLQRAGFTGEEGEQRLERFFQR